MNSFEILQAMTDIPNGIVLSARNKLGYEQENAIVRKAAPKRIWLIAAIVIMILCLVGCAVMYMLSLQDMKVGEYNFYVPPAYDEDGNLIYSGQLEIKRNGMGWPMIQKPKGFPLEQENRPKIECYNGVIE